MKRAHIIVDGRVQGVYFRSSMKKVADSNEVKGWVKNLPTGQVEALVEGEDSAVKTVIDWCWEGPPSARVDNVKVSWQEPEGKFKSFTIERY